MAIIWKSYAAAFTAPYDPTLSGRTLMAASGMAVVVSTVFEPPGVYGADLSDPAHPVVDAFTSSPDDLAQQGFVKYGDKIIMGSADRSYRYSATYPGVTVYDRSDLPDVNQVGQGFDSYPGTGGDNFCLATGMAVFNDGNHLLVQTGSLMAPIIFDAYSHRGFQIWDISGSTPSLVYKTLSPANPIAQGGGFNNIFSYDHWLADAYAWDDYVYLIYGSAAGAKFYIINCTTPSAPTITNRTSTLGASLGEPSSVRLNTWTGEHLLVFRNDGKVSTYDVTTRTNPTLVSTVTIDDGVPLAAHKVAQYYDFMICAAGSNIYLLDVRSGPPVLEEKWTSPDATDYRDVDLLNDGEHFVVSRAKTMQSTGWWVGAIVTGAAGESSFGVDVLEHGVVFTC